MRVLIAGCGYLGNALAARLLADGHLVFGLRRSVDLLGAGIRPIRADLEREATLEGLPGDLDALVYCAAAESWHDEAYRRAYVVGPSLLLRALAAQPPRFLLFTSSTGVYAQDDGSWVNEDSETRPVLFSGRRLLEGEAVFRAANRPGTILRLGGIYGPGRTREIDAVRRGDTVLAGRPRHGNRIHRDDAVGAIRHLIGMPEPPPLLLGVDHEPADEDEVKLWLSERLGLKPPAVTDGEDASRGANRRCENGRLLETGYRFHFPTFREGFAALIDGGK